PTRGFCRILSHERALTASLRMQQSLLRVCLTVVILCGSLGALLWSSLREGTAYYKHVDEVMVDPSAWEGKYLQLHGFVVPGSIQRKRNSLDYRFQVENKGAVVTARYSGIVPDTFKDSSEVVVRGRLERNAHFAVDPDGVMAKCPSKYEPKGGAGRVSPVTSPGG
ncbi:MAG: cytochrome c maturation protein CcmE, partial [Acidimicrobiia bacterium]